MSKRIIAYILFIVGIIVVSLGIYLIVFDDSKSSDSPSKENISSSFSGEYSMNDTIISIYQGDKKIYFILPIAQFIIDRNDDKTNTVSYKDNNYEYSFSIENNSLIVVSNNESIPSGTYNKKGEFTINDYFEKRYGEYKYLSSKYNGLYKKGDTSIYLFQNDEKNVSLTIESIYGTLSRTLYIEDNGILKSNEDIIISFNNDKITISYENDVTGIIEKLVGEYPKEKTFTIEDIINNDLFTNIYYE